MLHPSRTPRVCVIEPLESRIAPANLAFAVSVGGTGSQTIDSVAVDASGNTYIAGHFQGNVDFDPGPGVAARSALGTDLDGFVAKYDSDGTFSWVDVVRDSSRTTDTLHLAVSPAGDVFVLGTFAIGGPSSVGFSDALGPPAFTLNPVGTPSDIFVAKFDTLGSFKWATAYGSINSASATAEDIVVDGNGGIFIAGKIVDGGSIAFGSFNVLGDSGEDDIFVVKLNDATASPSAAWAADTTSAGTANFEFTRIALAPSGGVVVSSALKGAATFNTSPTPTSLTGSATFDHFVAALDASGQWTLAETLFNRGAQGSNASLAVNAAGEIYLAGSFDGTIDLNPGAPVVNVTAAGSTDFFFLKLNATGQYLASATIGGTGKEDGLEIGVAPDGSLRLLGSFNGSVDFDPSLATSLTLNAPNGGTFFATYSASFSPIEVQLIEATPGAIAPPGTRTPLAIDPFGGTTLVTSFSGQIDADLGFGTKTFKSTGGLDALVAHYFPGKLVAQDLQAPVVSQAFVLSADSGANKSTHGSQVLTDAAGNIYMIGDFIGTVDFDPRTDPGHVVTLTSAGVSGFVTKSTPAGNLVWARQIGANSVAGLRLGLDDLGDVFVAGSFAGNATLGALTLANPDATNNDVFVAKLDSNGTFVWAKSVGSAGQNDLLGAFGVRASTGDVVLGGSFSGTTDFDPGTAVAPRTPFGGVGTTDAFVLVLDSTGAFNWVHTLTSTGNVEFRAGSVGGGAVSFTSTGDVIASGTFDGTADFNPSGSPATVASSANTSDIFVTRLDGNGNLIWKQTFGGAGREEGGVSIVGSGDVIYVGGNFNGAVDFDPGPGTHWLADSGSENGAGPFGSTGDAFLLKLASDGSYLSAVSFGGSQPGLQQNGDGDAVTQLFLDGNGALYVAGQFNISADLDPGPGVFKVTGTRHNALFVSRFDAATLEFKNAFTLDGYNFAHEPGSGFDLRYAGVAFSVDKTGSTFFAGTFNGSLDVDPGPATRLVSGPGVYNVAFVKFAPLDVFDSTHPRSFHDANGDLVTVKLSGPGTGSLQLVGGAGDLADLARVELTGTTAASALTISVARFGSGDGFTTAQKVLTTGTQQHLGTIALGKNVTLGDGVADTDVDLLVSGAITTLTLDDLAANTRITLGRDLPYNFAADKTTPDTYNHRPALTIGDVLGPGVDIRVLTSDADASGKGTPQFATGGGGFSKVTIGSWVFPGFIRTTQSIGDFTVLDRDFYGVLEVDKFHVGAMTQADVGSMTVENGAWGSSGSEIEGDVKAFDAEAFLAGATITAGSIGTVTITDGEFAGTVILTDPDAASVGIFTVSTDFTGKVVASGPLKKLKIKGDFKGSLSAPSIGSITAFSFLGTTTGDTEGDADKSNITLTAGPLGTLTTTAGVVVDYEISTPAAFKGFAVKLGKLTVATAGLDRVKIQAASIGKISVALAASKTAGAISLIGIRDSQFVATGFGATKATAGSIGDVSVTLTGADGVASLVGIKNSTFDARVDAGEFGPNPASTINALGKITLKLGGQGGSALGLDHATFLGDTIGATHVTVGRGKPAAATARALDVASFTATSALGDLVFDGDATSTQVNALSAISGGAIGKLTIKSKTAANGSLAGSTILAGQALSFTGASDDQITARLAASKLGAVTTSGSVSNSLVAAGSAVGAVAIGGSIDTSQLLAGAVLGADHAIGGGDDLFQRAASIASITIKGALTASAIAAGVDSVMGGFGDGDDAQGIAAGTLPLTSAIGPVSLGSGTTTAVAAMNHSSAIQAAFIAKLTLPGLPPVTDFTAPLFVDLTGDGEDAADILVRLK